MNRSTAGCVPLATLLLATAAHAAEPGFYFAATASRVEHDVERRPGILSLVPIAHPPVLIIIPPPIFGVPINPILPPPVFEALRPLRVEVDEVDAGFSVTAGYRINRYLAAELSYTDFGEYESIERYADSAFDVRYQLGVSGPSVSVLGSLPLGEQWELYLRGGVLFAEQEVSLQPGSSVYERDFSDEVVMAGAGVQWSFAPRWAARLEYQSTDDLKPDNSGESSIDQASLSVLFKL
jgi:hypothetical protein